jgi:L-asparaginase
MPGRHLIRLLATGGTIATATDVATGRSRPTLGGEALVSSLGGLGADLQIEPRDVSSVPSWALGPEQMAAIARAARDAAREPGVRGVVVTHGTTTLEYTAFLADLLLDVDTPVVLTGAMRRADHSDPDGPSNLRDAILVAASDEARGIGALVVFAGRIMAAGRVWKARRLEIDAFVDLAGDLGQITDGRLELSRGGDAPTRRDKPYSGRLDGRVALVKAVPGIGDWALAAIPSETRGLVIEALPGVGGLPPGLLPAVTAIARRMPVIIASRAPMGRLPDTATGGTGEPLRDAAVLSAGSLTAEQAYLLLMAALADTDSPGEASARFIEGRDDQGRGKPGVATTTGMEGTVT